VTAFLRNALKHDYNYAFAASEAERIFQFQTARSQIRRWAIREGLATPERPARLPAHTRRWQRSAIGELWQLDATPDYWFGPKAPAFPVLDMLDDCSRLQVGCAIYRNETVPAYLHFLHNAFLRYGLPLQIYVDHASVFKGDLDNSVSRVQERLTFYGVSFFHANSPEAKGKVERVHQVWQDRLPCYFELNGVSSLDDIESVNAHIEALRAHRNKREIHREIGMPPQVAWDKALAERRNKLRPVPREPWWPYVWATWHSVIIGKGGRVHFQANEFPTQGAPGTRAVVCEHLDGSYSVLKERPNKEKYPHVLFSNRPQ
jgi:transposase InsO family protein